MKTWLLILTIFTIALVLFSFINTFLSFKKSEHNEKIIINILPIDEQKKSLPEVLPTNDFSFQKIVDYCKKLWSENFNFKKEAIALPIEVVQEEKLQDELLKLKISLDKGNLKETKLSTIKGVGVRTIEFFRLNSIETLGDLINLAEVDKTTRENIILGIPGLNSESSQIKHEKFSYFIKQAQEMVDMAAKELK